MDWSRHLHLLVVHVLVLEGSGETDGRCLWDGVPSTTKIMICVDPLQFQYHVYGFVIRTYKLLESMVCCFRMPDSRAN